MNWGGWAKEGQQRPPRGGVNEENKGRVFSMEMGCREGSGVSGTDCADANCQPRNMEKDVTVSESRTTTGVVPSMKMANMDMELRTIMDI
jgi:hypothetical protein